MVLVHQKLILITAVIAALLAFMQIKSRNAIFGSRALRSMCYGGLLLIFGALVGLVGSSGILGPGYSRSLAYFLLESIVGYIGGWSLIIWGMVGWLPYQFTLSSRLHDETSRLKLYESIMKTSSYGDASPAAFKHIARELMKRYNYQAASLHIPGRSGNLSLYASIGLPQKSIELINMVKDTIYNKAFESGDVFQLDEAFKIHKNTVFNSDAGAIVDALAVPVEFGTKRVGVMAVYTDHVRVFNQGELKALEAVGAGLALSLYNKVLQRAVTAGRSFRDFIAVIQKTPGAAANLNTRLVRLAKLMKKFVKFNSMHLYLFGSGAPELLDFELAGGSRLIVEKGFLYGDKYGPVNWVRDNKRGLVLPDESVLLTHAWDLPANSRVMLTPVVANGDVAGVLAIAMADSHRLSHNDKVVFETLGAAVSRSLLEEMIGNLTQELIDRVGAIKYSIEAAMTGGSSNQICRDLARLIVEKTPATFCRIMLMNPGRDEFLPKAIYQRRKLNWKGDNAARLPVSGLSLHREAILTGKTILAGQSDAKIKISSLEKTLLFPESINQCLINPIIIDGEAYGVVTIGESRRPDRCRIGAKEKVFAAALINAISLLLSDEQTALHRGKPASGRSTVIKRDRQTGRGAVDVIGGGANAPVAIADKPINL